MSEKIKRKRINLLLPEDLLKRAESVGALKHKSLTAYITDLIYTDVTNKEKANINSFFGND